MRAPNGRSECIQYHPGRGHHGELPYYKISSGKNGTVRYFIVDLKEKRKVILLKNYTTEFLI